APHLFGPHRPVLAHGRLDHRLRRLRADGVDRPGQGGGGGRPAGRAAGDSRLSRGQGAGDAHRPARLEPAPELRPADRGRDEADVDAALAVAMITAALLAAVAVLARPPRTRALATAGALVLTPSLLLVQVWDTPQLHPLRNHPLY